MATPYQLKIVAGDTGLWKVKQTDETAAKVSQLLQEDLEVRYLVLPACLSRGSAPELTYMTETPLFLQPRRFPQPRQCSVYPRPLMP